MSSPRACILSVSGAALLPDEARLLREADPFGVILMGRSCVSRNQVQALTSAIREATGRATLVFVDQEGGRVRRMRPPEWPDFPPAALYGRIFDVDNRAGLEAAELGHRLMAHEMRAVGVNADCAPCLDLLHAGAHAIIGDRAFGADPVKVARLGQAALDGLAAGGVAGVIKHMPGHGRAKVDSHEALPVVSDDRATLEADFAAFRALRHAPMAMTAHLSFPQLGTTTPVTHSSDLIRDLIRSDIGFGGLLMTDDLGMNALGGRLADRAARALAAGCDVALHCSGFVKDAAVILAEMEEVADASPPLAGASLERARAAEAAAGEPTPFEAEAGWRRFRDLAALAAGA